MSERGYVGQGDIIRDPIAGKTYRLVPNEPGVWLSRKDADAIEAALDEAASFFLSKGYDIEGVVARLRAAREQQA